MIRPAARPLGSSAASVVVFISSGAVLVLEILSLRLVAPYLGLTLEVSTAVIGCALAAITVGAWVGGLAADRFSPQRMLGPMVIASGGFVLLVGPLVRWAGEATRGSEGSSVMTMTVAAVFLPAALLSAVHPMVVKLRLGALEETGTVVGRLSGIGTGGALAGTFATGFILVGKVPTSRILLILGGALVLMGAGLTAMFMSSRAAVVGAGVAALGAGPIALAPQPCDVETKYHCARVLIDDARPTGRTLQLDTLWHSYIDLEDPTHLRFAYTRTIAAVLEETHAPGRSVRALHIGGGGATVARFLHATRPDSDNLVFEIDPGVVDIDNQDLGLREGDGLEVEVRDGRRGLAAQPDDSRDVVIGDAFGGVSVPWHLTTREVVSDVARVLDDGGVYVLNVIDYAPLGFARAELATLADVFDHVAVIASPDSLGGASSGGGNLILVGSDSELPLAGIRAGVQEEVPEYSVLDDEAGLAEFMGDARVLTDDFAPVDQLLTPHGS